MSDRQEVNINMIEEDNEVNEMSFKDVLLKRCRRYKLCLALLCTAALVILAFTSGLLIGEMSSRKSKRMATTMLAPTRSSTSISTTMMPSTPQATEKSNTEEKIYCMLVADRNQKAANTPVIWNDKRSVTSHDLQVLGANLTLGASGVYQVNAKTCIACYGTLDDEKASGQIYSTIMLHRDGLMIEGCKRYKWTPGSLPLYCQFTAEAGSVITLTVESSLWDVTDTHLYLVRYTGKLF